MSIRVTLPEKGSLPFIVPDKAEDLIREVHVLWRSPEDQLLVKIEKINDDGSDIAEISPEETIRKATIAGFRKDKVYLRRRKYEADNIPEEITIKEVVKNKVTYQFAGKGKKLNLQTVTENEFFEVIKKYNPK